MSVRHFSYIVCDGCLAICDGTDAATSAESRKLVPKQWARVKGTSAMAEVFHDTIPEWQIQAARRFDLCPRCQAELKDYET